MLQEAEGGLDYFYYRFGRSQQIFRGPPVDLAKPYVAAIGGTETFGKFINAPFCDQLSNEARIACANWGTPGAGALFFLHDPMILEACNNAQACVIQIMGAYNMSNRLYTVYPRRNGRLYRASDGLRALFPDTDFERFRFVNQMMKALVEADPIHFLRVENELRTAWIHRMRELLRRIESPKLLLWIGRRRPEDASPGRDENLPGVAPVLVTRDMLDAVMANADAYVKVFDQSLPEPGRELICEPEEADRAARLPGPSAHAEAAAKIAEALKKLK